jgi:hypothetical protein
MSDLGDALLARLALLDMPTKDSILALSLASQTLLKTSAHSLLYAYRVVLKYGAHGTTRIGSCSHAVHNWGTFLL